MFASLVRTNDVAAPKTAAKTPSGHKIEKGIQLPPHIPGANLKGRLPGLDLSGMKVGDSIFLKANGKKALDRARTNTQNAKKRAGITIATRAVEGGLRVWRLA